MRGGGSLEALMAFNNELIVREIASFPVPVIAAIGHDKDVPLTAMAADYAVSTPTAAAHLLSQSWQEIYKTLDYYQINLIGAYQNALNRAKNRLYENAATLTTFKYILQKTRLLLDRSISQMIANLKLMLAGARQQLEYAQTVVNSNNPDRQLKLGYSIARINGKILKSVRGANVGQEIDISVSDGIINSLIKSKKHGN
jgi:exodeoxyribonuclease VII large subunit